MGLIVSEIDKLGSTFPNFTKKSGNMVAVHTAATTLGAAFDEVKTDVGNSLAGANIIRVDIKVITDAP